MSPHDEVDAVRRENRALKSKRAGITSVAANRSEAKALIETRVRAMAAEGLAALNRDVAAIAHTGSFDPDSLRLGRALDLGPLLVALLGERKAIDAYTKHLDALEHAPPATERQAIVAEIDAQLFELELREERLIEATERTPNPIRRRADADPRAVLWLPSPPAAMVPATPAATAEATP